MATRQVTVLKSNYQYKNKNGEELRTKEGKPFWKVGIQFRTEDGKEMWANSLVFDEEARDYIKRLEEGTVIFADFTNHDKYGLQFSPKSVEVKSRPNVETNETAEAVAKDFGGAPVPGASANQEVNVEDIPF